MKRWRRESVLDLYNLLLATFLFVSPWLFARANGTAAMDLRASGAAIAALSLAAMVAFANWEEWANLLLGIWLIASPWALGFAHTRAMHFSIGVGVTVAFLAALELWLVYDASHPEPVPPRRKKTVRQAHRSRRRSSAGACPDAVNLSGARRDQCGCDQRPFLTRPRQRLATRYPVALIRQQGANQCCLCLCAMN